MTRQEFENITSWWELLEFCEDNGLCSCEDIMDEDQYVEYVEDDISNRECGWDRLRERLSDLPTDYEYYRHDGWLDYVGLDDDDDFDAYKEQTRTEAENDGVFDDDEEDEDDDYEYDTDFSDVEDDSDCEFTPFDGVSVIAASYTAFKDEQKRLEQVRAERDEKVAQIKRALARSREKERQKEVAEFARHVKEMSGLLDAIIYGAGV